MRRIKRAFTLVELLVVIVIIIVLVAIIFPVFMMVREKGRQTVCTSNLRQLGQALTMIRDQDGAYPRFHGWAPKLSRYVRNEGVLICPNYVEEPGVQVTSSYVYRLDGERLRHNGRRPTANSVILYCRDHAREEEPPEGLPRPVGPPEFRGAYVVLRGESSTKVIPAKKVMHRLAQMPDPVTGQMTTVVIREFPDE